VLTAGASGAITVSVVIGAVCNYGTARAAERNLAVCTCVACTRTSVLNAVGDVLMALGRAQTQVPVCAFVAFGVCFLNLAEWNLRHTDVVVMSECLSGCTAMAVPCGVVVLGAVVNHRNTLVKSQSRV